MIIDYINTHQGEFWITTGFILLALEVLIMGLSTIVFLFVGLGALLTGMLMLTGVLPETWIAGISSMGLASGLIATLLWKPMRRLQGARKPRADQTSDFIGLEFVCDQTVTSQAAGRYRYSGVDWRVELDPRSSVSRIDAGTRVKVTSLDAGILRVSPA